MNIFVINCRDKIKERVTIELEAKGLIPFLVDDTGYALVVRDDNEFYDEEKLLELKNELDYITGINIIKGKDKQDLLKSLYNNGVVNIEL